MSVIKAFRFVVLVLLIAQMTLIFSLSEQTADKSDKTSGGFISAVASAIYPDFEELSEEEQAEIISSYQFVVRKAAHASLYFILGGLFFLEILTFRKLSYVLRMFLSILLTAGYAVSDEYHQTFIPGRSGEIRDVLIDCTGAVLAILTIALIVRCSRKLYGLFEKERLVGTFDIAGEDVNIMKTEENNTFDEYSEFKHEIEIKDEKIRMLEEKIKNQNCKQNNSEPLKALEKKVVIQATLPKSTEYGASVIGKIVIEAAKYCNRLTAFDNSAEVKELVNLILGRTEVAKADILQVVISDVADEEKQTKIDGEYTAAVDYFESVMAQQK